MLRNAAEDAMKKIEWTEKCQHEALPRFLELAAEQMRKGRYDGDKLGELTENAKREDWWRYALAEIGVDSARVDREVRRIDALATGRLVREPERWGVKAKDETRKARLDMMSAAQSAGDGPWPRETARAAAKRCGGTAFRLTRIRRPT